MLDASTGKLHAGWPVRLPGEVRAPVLLTHIQPEEAGSPDIVRATFCSNLDFESAVTAQNDEFKTVFIVSRILNVKTSL